MALAAALFVALVMPPVTGWADPAVPDTAPSPFPLPERLAARVDFWVSVYTSYTTRQAILHDADHPEVIYGILDLGGVPDGGVTPYPEDDVARMDQARDRVARHLRGLADFHGPVEALSPEERQILDAAAALPGRHPLVAAAGRVRSQRGQSDRFRLGLARSGRYIDSFRALARTVGVPEDLAYLPHVESSFERGARSAAGAAGMWQFMPATARNYLAIDAARDERLDPWLAARSAFRLLAANHEALGSWPLAITAYNHGQGGMARAQRRYGDDLATIVDRYDARTFGFASKNFYAEFLAVMRIVASPEVWFGTVPEDAPIRFEPFSLPDFTRMPAFAAAANLSLTTLQALNPALRDSIWSGQRLAPRGYELRLPAGVAARVARDWSDLPGSFRFEQGVNTRWHRVRRGENLSVIAHRYGTSVSALVALNALGRRRTIYPGQRLKVRRAEKWTSIPGPGEAHHVVARGDTLETIARRYGVGVNDLARSNGLADPSRVLIGQVLVIPRPVPSP